MHLIETIWWLSNNEFTIVRYGVCLCVFTVYVVYSTQCACVCVCACASYCGLCGALLQIPEKYMVISQRNHTLAISHRLPQYAVD